MQRTLCLRGGGRGRKSRFPKALALLRKMTPRPGGPSYTTSPPKIQAPAPLMGLSHRRREGACCHTHKWGNGNPGLLGVTSDA